MQDICFLSPPQLVNFIGWQFDTANHKSKHGKIGLQQKIEIIPQVRKLYALLLQLRNRIVKCVQKIQSKMSLRKHRNVQFDSTCDTAHDTPTRYGRSDHECVKISFKIILLNNNKSALCFLLLQSERTLMKYKTRLFWR